MNIIIATTSPFFWQPQAEQFAVAMRRQGHEAEVITAQSIASFGGCRCDLLFCIGSGASLMPFLSTLAPRRKILYLIESVPTLTESDDFTRAKLRAHLPDFRLFDFVFVHTRRSLPLLLSLGLTQLEELIWPCFPALHVPVETHQKDIDVLFHGTMSPYRKQVLARIATKFPVVLAKDVFHQQLAPLYARAKIILNIHFTPLRNFENRVIEVLSCGGFLFTEALEPHDVFRDGEHLVVFDPAHVVDLIARHLQDDEGRRRIAVSGRVNASKSV